ncbi:hypothetical protein F0310_05370, partial (plasmid) [Borrelia sp. A-FGy1]|uniref:plasmid maintenance protein n=1 Tax=Borrelia sp. A-FGy1 TaxID=2608247 RepID=UPI0015F664D8
MITENKIKDNKNHQKAAATAKKASLLKELIRANRGKNKKLCNEITIYQVKAMIEKKFLRISRMCKLYWAINTKNEQYKSFTEQYSAKDILALTNSLLRRDKEKTVCSRTIQKDINLMNKIGLLKTETIRFGIKRGSLSFYVQNKYLAKKYKEIIQNELTDILKEELADKIIIGDLDKRIAKVKFDKEKSLRLLKEVEKKRSEEEESKKERSKIEKEEQLSPNSHVEGGHLLKTNNNYTYTRNSKEMPLKKEESKEKTKKRETRGGVEERLVSKHHVAKNYMQLVRDNSNNNATYINALLNLETALNCYAKIYKRDEITKHFLNEFTSKYKNKIWMMMRREDGVISDYEVIWEKRFKKKYKKNALNLNKSKQIEKTTGKNEEIEVEKQREEFKNNIFSILLSQITTI